MFGSGGMNKKMEFDNLLAAAEDGKYALLSGELYRDRTLVNAADQNGWTLLHRAAIFGQTRIIRLLLSHGANPNTPDNKRWIPLHCASTGYAAHLPSMCLLLRAGSRLEARTTHLLTPLMVCAEHSNMDGFAFLLGSGAKIDWRDRRKRDARAIASRQLEHSKGREYAQQREDLNLIIEMIDACTDS